MDLDGQSIEKRDFPVVRRGYEPAAVDAHLRGIANAVAELSDKARRGESVGAAAATQVQGIIDAAEAAAASIVGDAKAEAASAIEEARLSAQRTRSEAIAQSEAHIAAVAAAAATLRSRVESMDADLQALLETLRSGGSMLAQELRTIERDIAALYDAAGARREVSPPPPDPSHALAQPLGTSHAAAPPPRPSHAAAVAAPAGAAQPPAVTAVPDPQGTGNGALPASADASSPASADIDGARLIALNMALNGDSREQTERYLAEHFDLPDREKLIAEVYAAIEG